MKADDGIDRVVRRLSPVVAALPADDPAGPAARELRSVITRQSKETAMPEPLLRRRVLLVGLPAAAGLAAAAVVGTALLSPGSPAGPPAAEAEPLTIVREDSYLEVTVNDPVADPAEYAEQFAEYGLDVDLSLVPASPSLVGQVVAAEAGSEVEIVEAPGECFSSLGSCAIGVRIPVDHSEPVRIVFGRAPASGEQYQSSGQVDDPGELLEGVDLTGMRVAEAREVLSEHGLRAGGYRYEVEYLDADGAQTGAGFSEVRAEDEVPGDWYVHNVAGESDASVILFVGPEPEVERLPCGPDTYDCELLEGPQSPVPAED